MCSSHQGRWADAKYDYLMGPTVAIWLTPDSKRPAVEDLLLIAHQLDFQARSANEFHVASTAAIGGEVRSDNPRPFGLALGSAGLDDSELRAAELLLGFKPGAAVHAFAYVNAAVDHRILGALALFLAREFTGIVDFGGTLGRITMPVGKLLSIPYSESTLGESFHVGDTQFLEWWLRHDSFHMVK